MPKVEKMDLDSSLKETITYESQMLHYGLYTAGYQRVFQADIPWHWHDEFELGYISGGSVVYQTSGLTVTLHEGDAISFRSGKQRLLGMSSKRSGALQPEGGIF